MRAIGSEGTCGCGSLRSGRLRRSEGTLAPAAAAPPAAPRCACAATPRPPPLCETGAKAPGCPSPETRRLRCARSGGRCRVVAGTSFQHPGERFEHDEEPKRGHKNGSAAENHTDPASVQPCSSLEHSGCEARAMRGPHHTAPHSQAPNHQAAAIQNGIASRALAAIHQPGVSIMLPPFLKGEEIR